MRIDETLRIAKLIAEAIDYVRTKISGPGPFKNALAIPSEDRIQALLLTKSEDVLRLAEGVYSGDKGKSLEQFLAGRR